jgi:hypothetical protein
MIFFPDEMLHRLSGRQILAVYDNVIHAPKRRGVFLCDKRSENLTLNLFIRLLLIFICAHECTHFMVSCRALMFYVLPGDAETSSA